MQIIAKIQRKMGLWVLGQLILSAIIFAVTYIGLSLLGVRYALVLALIAGLMEVVPYMGPILSFIPAVFVAFMGFSITWGVRTLVSVVGAALASPQSQVTVVEFDIEGAKALDLHGLVQE